MIYTGLVRKGHGGASKCFVWENERRMDEIKAGLSFRPFPGSLNLMLDKDFDWVNYFKIQFLVMDVIKRPSLTGEWMAFPCNFYPCTVSTDEHFTGAWAMRFEKDIDRYGKNFIELISPSKIRDVLNLNDGDTVKITIGEDYV